MNTVTQAASSATDPTDATQLDALVIGAGVAGLYQLYRLREQGLKVRAVEAGSDVGGTWYWNRYPGARVDSQSHVYQYWFSKELNNEWSWTERFPAQPEIERYLNFVADRFDLRKDIQFNTRVTAASYDEAAKRWSITTDQGRDLPGAVPHQLLGDALGAARPTLPRAGRVQGPDLPHRALAQGASISPASASASSAPQRPASRSSRRSPARSAS